MIRYHRYQFYEQSVIQDSLKHILRKFLWIKMSFLAWSWRIQFQKPVSCCSPWPSLPTKVRCFFSHGWSHRSAVTRSLFKMNPLNPWCVWYFCCPSCGSIVHEIYMNQHFDVQQFCPVSKNAINLGKTVSSGFLSHRFIEAAGSTGSIGYMDWYGWWNLKWWLTIVLWYWLI